MNGYRWNPYVLLQNERVTTFWQSHFSAKHRRVLLIMGKGFDVRMNFTVKSILECAPQLDLSCMLIEFEEGKKSSSLDYEPLVKENVAELTSLLGKVPISKSIKLLSGKKEKRRVGDREAAELFSDYNTLKAYTDIIVDISALPRGIYFSLVGKILTLIDKYAEPHTQNLFITVAENPILDSRIEESEIDQDLNYLYGFGGGIELTADMEKPLIWFPILGEDKDSHIRKAFEKITETNGRLFEICPTLPFPSKNPRRSDSLLMEYHGILFDELSIERQNIMYVPEQNPFEAYVQLTRAIKNYNKSLDVLNGCKVALSTFSSKLLSIGTLLVAYENNENVGVLNVDTKGYQIKNVEEFKNLKAKSELYASWIAGEAYSEI